MRDHSGSESWAAVFIVGFLVILLLLIVGGAIGLGMWQRTVITQRAVAVARMEAEQQRAVAEQALAEVRAQTEMKVESTSDLPSNTEDAAAIEALLAEQQSAWNRGDIDGFMETYWQSEQLTFSSGGSTTRSWQSTLERYKNKYATPEAMGKLNFSDIEVQVLAPEAAMVLGRWALEEKSAGNFTLVLRKFPSGWLIVHDHTSVDENSAPEE